MPRRILVTVLLAFCLAGSCASIPGAVGLVDVYSINSRVNVLKVDGKLPLEQGYFLKSN